MTQRGESRDLIFGNRGNDTIESGEGGDIVYGDLDPATRPNGGNDTIYLGSGNDLTFGGGGQDLIYGEEGNDVLLGELGNDTLYGGDGDDIVTGDASPSNTGPYGGDDVLRGEGGDDRIYGNHGNDTIIAGNGKEWVEGGAGNDKIRIDGQAGTYDGQDGDDIFSISRETQNHEGVNTLIGREGSDSFYFEKRDNFLEAGRPISYFYSFAMDQDDAIYWNGYQVTSFQASYYSDDAVTYADSNGLIFHWYPDVEDRLEIVFPDLTILIIDGWVNGVSGISVANDDRLGDLIAYYYENEYATKPGAPVLGGTHWGSTAEGNNALAKPGQSWPDEFWL